MSMAQKKGHYTVADYALWPEGERWELIDGEAYLMTPAPSRRHQQIAAQLVGQFLASLQGRPCTVYPAPSDLTFGDKADDQADTVVQPDLFVMCGSHGGTENRVIGVPVLIIEILSPSSARRDKIVKLALYQRVGVKEYWIVDPIYEVIDVFVHNGTEYGRSQTVAKDDSLALSTLDGVSVDVEAVFTQNRAPETEE